MGRTDQRRRWPVGGPLFFVALALIGSCESATTDERPGALGAAGEPPDAPSGSGGSQIFAPDGAGGTNATNPDTYDAADVGPQPLVECGDGGDTDGASESNEPDVCPPPPSRCFDSEALVYYLNGRCVDGRCVWDHKIRLCGTSCRNDGCYDNVTRAASP